MDQAILAHFGIGGLVLYFVAKEIWTLWKKWNGDYISYKELFNKVGAISLKLTLLNETYEKHVEDDSKMKLEMEKFFSRQDQLNTHFKELFTRDSSDIQSIFKMLSEIKTILIERK